MSHISSYKDTNHIHEGLKGPTSKYHQAEKKYECGGDTNIQCTANNTLLLTDIKIILPRHLDTSIYEIQWNVYLHSSEVASINTQNFVLTYIIFFIYFNNYI